MPYFKVDDASIFYVTDGPDDGKPALLIHGWACDSQDWQFQLAYLHSLNYRTIVFDARGHGGSSVPPATDRDQFRSEVWAADAVALLDHLNITQPVLIISHSAGCLTASLLAARWPDRVQAYVMIDPEHYRTFDAGRTVVNLLARDAHGGMLQILARSYSVDTPSWLKMWHRYRVLRTAPHVIHLHLDMKTSSASSVAVWDSAQHWMRDRKTCPRLVVFRDETNVDKERSLGVTDRDVIKIMGGGGHWMHILKSDDFNDLLGRWLENVKTV